MRQKTFEIFLIVLVIALIALTVSIINYLKIAEKTKIEISEEKPTRVEYTAKKLEGPTYTGTSNGSVIKFENGKVFYISGDTCLFGDMKWVIADYYQPDMAFLTAGNVFTMDSKDAAFATTWINPKYVAMYHYKIFPFLEQTSDNFIKLVNQYRQEGKTKALPIALEPGVEQEIEGIKITWLGHGGFYFISPTGTKILIDPWFTPNPDTPARFKDMSIFGKVDLLLITHGHLDHFDFEDMKNIVTMYDPAILSQWEVMGYLQPKIPGQYIMMNKGGRITKEVIGKQKINVNMPEKMEITMVQAEHSSSAP